MWKSRWENSNKALLDMAEDVSTLSLPLGGSTLSNNFSHFSSTYVIRFYSVEF